MGNSSVTLKNTIIAGNSATISGPDCYGSINSAGYNLIGNNSGCSFQSSMGDLMNIDPKFGPLWGSPAYYPLAAGSPAIDAGNPAVPGSGGNACLTGDERGVTRPVGARCDIGAYEYTVPDNTTGILIISGDDQSAVVASAFPDPLEIIALDAQGNPMPNVSVTFTAPDHGASAIFSDTGTQTTTVMTNVDGVATTSKFSANAQYGSYTIVASASGVGWVSFDIQNVLPTFYVATTGSDASDCRSPMAPCATINAAISKASVGGTINVAVGMYTSTGSEVVLAQNKIIVLSGGWNVGFTTQNGTSVLDGGGARYSISTNSNANVVMERFTIQNGYGISNYESSLTVNNSSVVNNITDGSAVTNHGTLTINNTTISNNTGGDPCCAGGGGGGAINNHYGTLTLNNSLVSNNVLVGGYSGSGIYNVGTLILNNSTVSGNKGGDGTGIYTIWGSMILNNSTISYNESYGFENVGSNVTLQNTIVAQNGDGRDCYNNTLYGGPVVSHGYNLIGNATLCSFSSTIGDLVGSDSHLINPRLASLQNNGGSTLTHALMEGSSAINAGNPGIPGNGGNTCLLTDQRGTVRPVDARCDIGAYEGSVPWTFWPLAKTYTANSADELPGIFLCNQNQQPCTSNNTDPHANAAHQYAIGISNFYATKHGRDSIDNNGMVIKSSVHYCGRDENGILICPYDNAFWDGEQMVYGDAHNWPMADDVVAHELTHGVTQYESGLFSYYQSGAIDESLADLWGEYYDQTNGQGNDSGNVRWLLGEDLTTDGSFILRSMSNPPAYGDPDKMSSSNYQKLPYYDDWWDNGGVHTNSGINNKAVYLMVDGGTFNGRTVTTLGWDKTAAVYYEANTNLLFSGADYSDLYYAVQQACINLVGQNNIVWADCIEVQDAIDAVEMNGQPAANYNPNAPYCDSGKAANQFFMDDLEYGMSNWTIENGSYLHWQYDSPYGQYAQSGNHFLYADDYPQYQYSPTDARATLKPFVVPNNAYLMFSHAYDFEYYSTSNYDGGVLEYSINGGATWVDAGSLIQNNGYNGKVYSNYINPLKGRSAFVGSSHGYVMTRLNLASLAGQTVSFRWRMGLDDYGIAWGWWVDNIQAYTCGTIAVISGKTGMPGVTLTYYDGMVKTVTSQADGSYSFQVGAGWTGVVSPSLACYKFDPPQRSYLGIAGNKFNENYAPSPITPPSSAEVHVEIGGVEKGSYTLARGDSTRQNYAGIDSGPVKVASTNCAPIVASLRDLWWNGSAYTSSIQLMGLPQNLLSDTYIFPSYNNVSLNDQLRFGNVGNTNTTVLVYIGGQFVGSYDLAPGQRQKASYPGLDSGPVIVKSSNGVPIIASIRDAWINNGVTSSFSQLMGLPQSLLSDTYYFPSYNNVNLSDQIRFGNVGNAQTTVTITIGGVLRGTYVLQPNQREKATYPGLDSGPVIVHSSNGVPIIASLREAWLNSGVTTSYFQMMGLPQSQISDKYVFPSYDNVSLSGQLRFGNIGNASTTVNVTVGGVLKGTYNLAPSQREKVSYPGLNSGPVVVQSSNGVPIIVALRDAWLVNGVTTSFSQLMGLPGSQLSTVYIFPSYNNATYDNQLRIGVP